MRPYTRALGFATLALVPLTACAQSEPDGRPVGGGENVAFERAFPNLGGLDRLTEIRVAPGQPERFYVTEQLNALVQHFEREEDVSASTVFLDLSDRVQAGGEEGLLGLTFHPDYEANGRFYVYYSAPNPRRSVVSEFQRSAADPLLADPASERILLEVPQPFSNHNGGKIEFGPDGYLYISLGDGGSGGDPEENGQDRTELLGSILRIDVEPDATTGSPYTIPADNPFVGNADGYRAEIYAYGLRNVWRFSFDRETGQLFGADVGQNAFEEVDEIVLGGNYGWDVKEGFACYETPGPGEPACSDPSLIDPLLVYGRSEGQSVTGGFVYRGAAVPQAVGRYVFADFVSGTIWTTDLAQEDPVLTPIGDQSGFTAFGEDEDGELYAVTFGGDIYRFVSLVNPATEPGAGSSALRLDAASANPAPAGTPVRFAVTVPGGGAARLSVLDALGREVAVAYDGLVPAGEAVAAAVTQPLAAGLYVARLVSAGREVTRTFTVVE